jgi:5-aminopentanamidase
MTEPASDAGRAADTTVVACCQLAPVLGDPVANRGLAADAVSRAAAAGAGVVVLPELVSSGYVFQSRGEARDSAEAADGETVALWARLAADHGIVIVGGFCEIADGELFNSAALVDPGGLRCVYRKAHLWDRERFWFSPGSAAPPVVTTRFGRIGVMICYDLEFPEWVRLPALDGAQLLCAPTNWPAFPRPEGERPAEIVRVQAGAAVNRMFIAACDRTGEERGVGWVAGSVIVDPDGWPLAEADRASGPVTITAACRLAGALDKATSPNNDVHADRRPELYRRVAEDTAPRPARSPG